MRTFDLTPLYRSTVGFDRLFSLLDQGTDGAVPGYPPYNIERTGDNEYRVTQLRALPSLNSRSWPKRTP